MHDAMRGAVDLGDGLTPVDIWQGLHAGARSWERTGYGMAGDQDRTLIDASDLSVLRSLQNFPAASWRDLCSAAGWTVYGSIALAWCQGATVVQVWDGWLASEFPLKPLPEYERPARFLNPALIPQTQSLVGIAGWVNGLGYKYSPTYDLAIAAVIAGLKAPLIFDMGPELMLQARPQIAAFLKSRMLQKPARNAEEERLLEVWSASVKGSPYDIWEKP